MVERKGPAGALDPDVLPSSAPSRDRKSARGQGSRCCSVEKRDGWPSEKSTAMDENQDLERNRIPAACECISTTTTATAEFQIPLFYRASAMQWGERVEKMVGPQERAANGKRRVDWSQSTGYLLSVSCGKRDGDRACLLNADEWNGEKKQRLKR